MNIKLIAPDPKALAKTFGVLNRSEPNFREVFLLEGVMNGTSAKIISGVFDNPEAVLRGLDKVTEAKGCYISLNPVLPELYKKEINLFHLPGKGGRISANGVRSREWLLVDLDPVRLEGTSSTAGEHQSALALAGRIASDLKEFGFPDPIRADSGNGAHLLYPIDLPVEDGGLVKSLLQTLDALYSTGEVSVDTRVFDPARATKLYGTLTRKGEGTLNRPHRNSSLLALPTSFQPVPESLLRELAGITMTEASPVGFTDLAEASPSQGEPPIECEDLSPRPDHVAFRTAMEARGLIPPLILHPNGQIHRCATKKHPDRQDGSYLLAGGCRRGGFQNWGDEHGWEHWVSQDSSAITEEERAAQSELAAVEREERAMREAAAADRAEQIWNEASPCETHPYLVAKSVLSHGLRTWKDMLLVPVTTPEGRIASLQMIQEDGKKRFLKGGRKKGCYLLLGSACEGPICIAEGYATAATIHQATGFAVAVAFDCGNLVPVATALRTAFPTRQILVCGDDDAPHEDPGATQAEEAARAINGRFVLPWWPAGQQIPKVSDFNDLAHVASLELVKANIQAGIDGWSEPQPLFATHTETPYPIDALPPLIRGAVEEVCSSVQAPEALVASSALGALSLATQQHFDVKRAEGLTGPTGLFFLSIADSGERKSSCDKHFSEPIKAYEAEQALLGKAATSKAKGDLKGWSSQCEGLELSIREGAKAGHDVDGLKSQLRDLEEKKPGPPRIPKLVYSDFTPEALNWKLATVWPSAGIVSSEAGSVFGSHGMSPESVMRSLSAVNQLWDGSTIEIDRRGSESFVVRGARLTFSLLIQETVLKTFMERTGSLARGSGFLARFLLTWPVSKIGYRPFREAPSWSCRDAFQQRLRQLVELPAAMDENGGLTPRMLSFCPEAKSTWISFHDRIEYQLRAGGEYADIKDVACKSADNAARLAALFHAFEGHDGDLIGVDSIRAACRIVEWHLGESRRFYGQAALPPKLTDAQRIEDWLVGRMRATQRDRIPTQELQQGGPGDLRPKAKHDPILQELAQLSRVRIISEGRRKYLAVNPVLMLQGP